MKEFVGWVLIIGVLLGFILRAVVGIEVSMPNAIIDASALIAGAVLLRN